jgi:hypothetical protein
MIKLRNLERRYLLPARYFPAARAINAHPVIALSHNPSL